MYLHKYNRMRMEEILAESSSIKKVKKKLHSDKKLILCLKDRKGCKIHDPKGTAEVATCFYERLYEGNEEENSEWELEECKEENEAFPEIMDIEVRKAIL